MEDNRKISPRDYLEIALRPVQGTGGDIGAKNEVLCYFFFEYVYLDSQALLRNPGLVIKCNSFGRIIVCQCN